MYSHYIKINENNDVIKIFSSWQTEELDGTEIFYRESMDRHFNSIEGRIFVNSDTLFQFKWTGSEIVEKTHAEIYTVEVIASIEREQTLRELSMLDVGMPRALEDIYQILQSKNVILETEIPDEVKAKIDAKKVLRYKL